MYIKIIWSNNTLLSKELNQYCMGFCLFLFFCTNQGTGTCLDECQGIYSMLKFSLTDLQCLLWEINSRLRPSEHSASYFHLSDIDQKSLL